MDKSFLRSEQIIHIYAHTVMYTLGVNPNFIAGASERWVSLSKRQLTCLVFGLTPTTKLGVWSLPRPTRAFSWCSLEIRKIK